ncbi:MAG TPA: hypothetical protein PLV68_10285, partial [Ilumatobacteraceae bacterium]|nr:hypothetical protein [Ilumatobacteraceae bacterium]
MHQGTANRRSSTATSNHAPAGYQPYGAFAPAAKTSGKLIAAGVMEFIQAAFFVLVGILLIGVSNDVDRTFGFGGGSVAAVGVVVLAIGGALIAAGVGAVRGRQWGRIFTIVLQSLALLLFIASL